MPKREGPWSKDESRIKKHAGKIIGGALGIAAGLGFMRGHETSEPSQKPSSANKKLDRTPAENKPPVEVIMPKIASEPPVKPINKPDNARPTEDFSSTLAMIERLQRQFSQYDFTQLELLPDGLWSMSMEQGYPEAHPHAIELLINFTNGKKVPSYTIDSRHEILEAHSEAGVEQIIRVLSGKTFTDFQDRLSLKKSEINAQQKREGYPTEDKESPELKDLREQYDAVKDEYYAFKKENLNGL